MLDKEELEKAFKCFFIDHNFEVISHAPPRDLIELFDAIPYQPAREDAFSILYDINTYQGEHRANSWVCPPELKSRLDNTWCLSRDQGIMSVIRGAKVYASRKLLPKGPMAISKELDGLQTAMLEVAGRLNKLSEASRYCLEMIPIRDEGNPNPEEVRDEYWAWVDCNAEEAFLSNDLANRLEAMAKILNGCANETKEHAQKRPGDRTYFSPPPVDLRLFDGCAKLLKARERTLANLRVIASTVFEFITKTPVSPTWAERQEETAKRKHGTNPPKEDKGVSIPD